MQVAGHGLEFAVSFVNLQRRVPDSNRGVVHHALWRCVHAHRLRPERRHQERNHLVRLAKMQVRLD